MLDGIASTKARQASLLACDIGFHKMTKPRFECDECGHANAHGKYGCEYEYGDVWVTGNQPDQPTVLMAHGQCGCDYQSPYVQTGPHLPERCASDAK